jgi:hypothetical protein
MSVVRMVCNLPLRGWLHTCCLNRAGKNFNLPTLRVLIGINEVSGPDFQKRFQLCLPSVLKNIQ